MASAKAAGRDKGRVLERAIAIEGWMTPAELAFLQALALRLPAHATVVELGAYKGRSTVAIREALDPDSKLVTVDQAALDAFRENTAGLANLDLVIGDSAEAASGFADASVDLVIIDADHSYHAVKRDIQAWHPKLKSGALLTGHDWGWVGVRVAVKETFGRVGLFETIWYTDKQPGIHPAGHLEKQLRRILGRLDVQPDC